MMRSAKAQWKPTSLQWALIVVSLVIVLVTALWPSSADREPGLFGIATRPGARQLAPPKSCRTPPLHHRALRCGWRQANSSKPAGQRTVTRRG